MRPLAWMRRQVDYGLDCLFVSPSMDKPSVGEYDNHLVWRLEKEGRAVREEGIVLGLGPERKPVPFGTTVC